jgi:hypothetical protein
MSTVFREGPFWRNIPPPSTGFKKTAEVDSKLSPDYTASQPRKQLVLLFIVTVRITSTTI